ncbi:hypothetical protein G7K_5943-t1 [Saitoella complicata NRRL Y-17804]|uniref:Uncharacterized protein n=1 Tax=Saitoella complicata (strain BCRC 22490 / CBS 7301 / JCM 7358 / NBRC 10748 / NRRL Y-17804) TaxID=698492 RepID=A0A0E9NPP2_SAICN|nr:hypothetical protein G7K_5943-t1 [Saitoella complicata NRRL Y-17804]
MLVVWSKAFRMPMTSRPSHVIIVTCFSMKRVRADIGGCSVWVCVGGGFWDGYGVRSGARRCGRSGMDLSLWSRRWREGCRG